MKVYAFCKIKASSSNEEGDIISFHRITDKIDELGKDALNHFMPVIVDINIPCKEKFNIPPNYCNRCKFNDPESCDVIKYTRGVWSAGDLFNAPKLLSKRKYYINWKGIFEDQGDISKIETKVKTDQEKVNILTISNTQDELTATVILEKEG